MSRPKGATWATATLKAVEKMVEALPSEQEVNDGIRAIDALMGFLERLRTLLSEQPPATARQDVLKAASVLSAFLSSYGAKVLLAEKPKAVRSSPRADAGAEDLVRELKSLSLEEIQTRLLDKNRYSVKQLKSLATHLGIHIDKSLRRNGIADIIYKRGFANPRGYQALGGTASETVESEAQERASRTRGDQRS